MTPTQFLWTCNCRLGINAPTYLLAEYLKLILPAHTTNEYTVKKYLDFVEVVANTIITFIWLVSMLSH